LTVAVRRADVADARAIAHVHVAASRAAYAGLLPPDDLSVDGREIAWRGSLAMARASSFTLVAEVARDVVGFCDIVAPSRDADASGTTAELASIYVDPNRWRGGIGRLLVEAAFSELSTQEMWRDVTLWVFLANDRALGFYKAVGFLPDGKELVHEASGLSQLRLRAPLVG
jgi:ribosomal protein S18 acetylase RimI-like enzyme